MRKKLQIILEDDEYREITCLAHSQSLSIVEWVRCVLLSALDRHSNADVAKKLAAVRRATRYEFPVADIDHMLVEIKQGYRFEKHES